jgi:hypothetical protein
MILPDFVLHSRINQSWKYSGIDSFEDCLDQKHFNQYPYSITYNYNSRGFRDQEWPESLEELKSAIWCVGDSFTVGLGSPIEHTWPWLLQQQSGLRTVNVSMDGASNNWIARKTLDILQQINPQHIVLHWSYFDRRENPDSTLSDEQRRQHCNKDELEINDSLTNFYYCIDQVEKNKGSCTLLHSMIPGSYPGILDNDVQEHWRNVGEPSWPPLPDYIENIPEFIKDELKTLHQCWDYYEKYYYVKGFFKKTLSDINNIGWLDTLDLARDGHHYDILTSQIFVNQIINLLGLDKKTQ